jgi:hypothetical protein
MEKTELK